MFLFNKVTWVLTLLFLIYQNMLSEVLNDFYFNSLIFQVFPCFKLAVKMLYSQYKILVLSLK